MRFKFSNIYTVENTAMIIIMIVIISILPIPDKWNIMLDKNGSNLSDYRFFSCMYAILTILCLYIGSSTNNIIFKILTGLSFGKLVDQFCNPYGYHFLEIVWDIVVIIYVLYSHEWKRTQSSQKQ